MLLSFSFPIVEQTDSIIRTRVRRINRFFLKKTDLSAKTRSFGLELLTPDNRRLEKYLDDLFIDNQNYYLFFKFFDSQRNEQPKLELFLNLGNDRNLIQTLEFDICSLSRLSALSLQYVTFACNRQCLSIVVELSNTYSSFFDSYLKMLSDNFIAPHKEEI